ncbi:MAG: hypothetical protein AAGD06_21880 [Acidobacteriota bacterium]
MSSKLRTPVRLLAVLLCLVVFAQVATAADDTVAVPAAEAPSAPAGEAASLAPAAGCATGAAAGVEAVKFGELDPSEAWGRQNASSCTYTCPFGLVALCPDRIGYVKSCVNGCCQLTPDCAGGPCATNFDCAQGQACNANTGCCS